MSLQKDRQKFGGRRKESPLLGPGSCLDCTFILIHLLFSTPEEEYSENLHKVSMLMRGEVGLLCTNEKTEDVIEFFDNLSAVDYARYI